MNNLERQAALVLDGRITFDAFARTTTREFHRMAASLTRRWAPPPWHGQDDVVQDLYLGAWLTMWGFDPRRGTSLSRFVVYNAMSRAKRELHRARGAKLSGSPDRNASRIPLTFDASPERGEDGLTHDEAILNLAAEDAIAEIALVEREERDEAVARALAACESSVEELAMSAIVAAGSVDGAAARIFDDFERRIELRLPSEEHAARLVARLAESVVRRFVTGDEP